MADSVYKPINLTSDKEVNISLSTNFSLAAVKVRNFIMALANHVAKGMPRADADEIERRLAVCETCNFLQKDKTCGSVKQILEGSGCGCKTPVKAKWLEQKCPQNKWNLPWFHQVNACQLGDFIVSLPAIQTLALSIGQPVGVYFDNDWLWEIVKDVGYIVRLKQKPAYPSYFYSCNNGKNRRPSVSEQKFQPIAINYQFKAPRPHWTIDACRPPYDLNLPPGPKIAVVHGARRGARFNYRSRKDLGRPTQIQMVQSCVNHGFTPVIIGNSDDWNAWWMHVKDQLPKETCWVLDRNIRDAVGVSIECCGFLANDTGLSHLWAGPLSMQGLIIDDNSIARGWFEDYPRSSYSVRKGNTRGEMWASDIDKKLAEIKYNIQKWLPPEPEYPDTFVSVQVPYAPRKTLKDPQLFVQLMLRCFLCDFHPNRELVIGINDTDKQPDWDNEIRYARNACKGWGSNVEDVAIRFVHCKEQKVGLKRNELIDNCSPETELVVTADSDDVYLQTRLSHIVKYMTENPECTGSLSGARVGWYQVEKRIAGYFRYMGSSYQVWRKADLEHYGFRYPGSKAASDTHLRQDIRTRFPDFYSHSTIPNLGEHIVVLRLPSGHTSKNCEGIRDPQLDLSGVWLWDRVPPPLKYPLLKVFECVPWKPNDKMLTMKLTSGYNQKRNAAIEQCKKCKDFLITNTGYWRCMKSRNISTSTEFPFEDGCPLEKW